MILQIARDYKFKKKKKTMAWTFHVDQNGWLGEKDEDEKQQQQQLQNIGKAHLCKKYDSK